MLSHVSGAWRPPVTGSVNTPGGSAPAVWADRRRHHSCVHVACRRSRRSSLGVAATPAARVRVRVCVIHEEVPARVPVSAARVVLTEAPWTCSVLTRGSGGAAAQLDRGSGARRTQRKPPATHRRAHSSSHSTSRRLRSAPANQKRATRSLVPDGGRSCRCSHRVTVSCCVQNLKNTVDV